MELNISLLGLVTGYLIGSIPLPQIIAKLVKGIDLRTVGSKNVGTMNTARSIGIGWGIIAATFDVTKSIVAIMVARELGTPYPTYLWAGIMAVIGHNWPIWLKFRGGKGLATGMGVMAWIVFPEAFIGFIIGVLVFLASKNMTLTALSSFLSIAILSTITQRPIEFIQLIWSTIGLLVIAILPNFINIMRKPGGFKDYMQNPNKDYQENLPTNEKK